MAQNLPRGTPARLLVLLTLLTGLVTVSAWRDALQRERAVWVNYPTALGDEAFFDSSQPPRLVQAGGKTVLLSAVPEKTLRRRDDRMFRAGAGLSEMLPFQLYTTRENAAEGENLLLHAKTAPGAYVLLHAAPHDAGSPIPALARPVSTGTEPAPAPESSQASESAPTAPDFPAETGDNKSL